MIHHKNTYCTPKTSSIPTGAVTDGQLCVEGTLYPVAIAFSKYKTKTDTYRTYTFVMMRDTAPLRIRLDLRKGIEILRDDPAFNCWQEECHDKDFKHDLETWGCTRCRRSIALGSGFWCLKIMTIRHGDRRGSSTYFLVLERSSRVPGAFERIGIGSTSHRNSEEDSQDTGPGYSGEGTTQSILIV